MTWIMIRITGVALSFGLIMFSWWLCALAGGIETHMQFQNFAGSWYGQFLLMGFSFSLIYHLLNGIRHLMWDAGNGIDIASAYRSGWLVIFGTALLTLVIWAKAYGLIF
jgi:succinate dehydrogenase / fumarate reductase cytochrome b subunit